jgi:hydrogenase-4 component H
MFKWLKESLDAGNATVGYPFEPMRLTPDMRGKPEHDAYACIACGACATACPPNAIQMDLDLKEGFIVWRIDYGRCIFCGRCEESCPTRAIVLTQEFELAVMSKADLEETAHYRLQACRSCGKAFAPRKEILYLRDLLASNAAVTGRETGAAEELLELCPACKRATESRRIQELFIPQKERA